MWSFGVLLWEIYSYGRVPYPRIVSVHIHTCSHTHTHMLTHMLTHTHAHTHTCTQPVEDVAQHIEKGYRMDAPDGSPDAIHRIMQECWNKDPSQRPNFTRIERQLDTIAIS